MLPSTAGVSSSSQQVVREPSNSPDPCSGPGPSSGYYCLNLMLVFFIVTCIRLSVTICLDCQRTSWGFPLPIAIECEGCGAKDTLPTGICCCVATAVTWQLRQCLCARVLGLPRMNMW